MEEPQLNGRIASVINKLTKSAGWQAREELWNALRGPRTKPDVLITRADGPSNHSQYQQVWTREGDFQIQAVILLHPT